MSDVILGVAFGLLILVAFWVGYALVGLRRTSDAILELSAIDRDLRAGRIDNEQAQKRIDKLVEKIRGEGR